MESTMIRPSLLWKRYVAGGNTPPGTSKWNKIEHRMFCHITENWRGKPLVSRARAVIVNLIESTHMPNAANQPPTKEVGCICLLG
jgi:DDE family transposase